MDIHQFSVLLGEESGIPIFFDQAGEIFRIDPFLGETTAAADISVDIDRAGNEKTRPDIIPGSVWASVSVNAQNLRGLALWADSRMSH